MPRRAGFARGTYERRRRRRFRGLRRRHHDSDSTWPARSCPGPEVRKWRDQPQRRLGHAQALGRPEVVARAVQPPQEAGTQLLERRPATVDGRDEVACLASPLGLWVGGPGWGLEPSRCSVVMC